VRPYPIKHARKFNREVHRRLPKLTGAMWALAAIVEAEIAGVAVVGHPQARLANDGYSLEVLRVAVRIGAQNACSALYGATARAARAMGVLDIFSYIHLDESGHSVQAAGWIEVAQTDGGEWDRDGRQRMLAVDPSPKKKFAPPWTRLAQKKLA
jgi:hypothetical protein